MWELIKMAFLAAVVSISGGKRDFAPGNYYHFELSKPLVAINEGARVYVDITSMQPKGQTLDMSPEWVSRFPNNCMTIKLIPKEVSREPMRFTYQGNVAETEDSIYLVLASDKVIPTFVQYKAVEFETAVQLNNVELTWENSSM